MFDTVLGLPVHALVVHGVVVLLPLMALVTIVVALVPRLRFLAWPVVAADAGIVAMTFVARESGEALQERLGGSQVAAEHAALGRNVIWFALGLLVASVIVATARGSRRILPAGVVTVVAGALVVIWTVRTGHSGSEAVWAEIVSNTNK